MKVTVKTETVVYFSRQEINEILRVAAETETKRLPQPAVIVFEHSAVEKEEVSGVTLTFRDSES